MTKNLLEDLDTFNIDQRRYLGNKSSLLKFIEDIVKKNISEYDTFCDVFAGTGVVGAYFNNNSTSIISNELLYHNYITNYAFLGVENYDDKKIKYILKELNNLSPTSIDDNYMSIHFGGTYFTANNAKKIGKAREIIETYNINFREKSILITSIIYGMDKVANTCGHYDAFRKKLDKTKSIEFKLPYIYNSHNNCGNEIYNKDANNLIKYIECDILYLDPPYNSRQYCDTYHLLENVAKWNKPEVYGKAKKFDRSHLKSDYNYKNAPSAFSDLVDEADCEHILLSYSNMGQKGHSRSNARISDKAILDVLSEKGNTEVFTQDFKQFTTGQSNIDNHAERIFWCNVSQ